MSEYALKSPNELLLTQVKSNKVRMHKSLLTIILILISSLFVQAQQGQVSIDQDPGIDQLLDIYKEFKANTGYYTIQVGFGTYDEAVDLRKEVSMEFPEFNPNVIFDSPTYRVQVGKFNSRLEAEKKYLEVRKKFPGSLLLRPENGDR